MKPEVFVNTTKILVFISALFLLFSVSGGPGWRYIPENLFTRDVSNAKMLKLFETLKHWAESGNTGICHVTDDEYWHLVAHARLNGINPVVAVALAQKEQSLFDGPKTVKKWLALGYHPEEKSTFGFYVQVIRGLRCLRMHYDAGCSEKVTLVRLQDGGGYAHVSNAAEYALFRYNPLIAGNAAFNRIFFRYWGIVNEL